MELTNYLENENINNILYKFTEEEKNEILNKIIQFLELNPNLKKTFVEFVKKSDNEKVLRDTTLIIDGAEQLNFTGGMSPVLSLILFFALFLNVVTAFQAFPTNAIKNKNRIIHNEETIEKTIEEITTIVDGKIDLLNKIDTTIFYVSNIIAPLIKNNEIIQSGLTVYAPISICIRMIALVRNGTLYEKILIVLGLFDKDIVTVSNQTLFKHLPGFANLVANVGICLIDYLFSEKVVKLVLDKLKIDKKDGGKTKKIKKTNKKRKNKKSNRNKKIKRRTMRKNLYTFAHLKRPLFI